MQNVTLNVDGRDVSISLGKSETIEIDGKPVTISLKAIGAIKNWVSSKVKGKGKLMLDDVVKSRVDSSVKPFTREEIYDR